MSKRPDLDVEDPNEFDAPHEENDGFVQLPAVRKGLSGPNPEVPTHLGFPPMFPIELAMGQFTPREVCEAYNITRDQFAEIVDMPVFQQAFKAAQEMLAKDGASFKVKAKMMAENVLETAYKMVHNVAMPAPVRADLAKSIVRWAGYEPIKSPQGSGVGNAFQININL